MDISAATEGSSGDEAAPLPDTSTHVDLEDSTQISKPDQLLGEENKFQKAISAWRTIDLNTLMPILDSEASDIVSHQRDSLVQRKDLAQKTKDFRKLDDASKLAEIKSLLKAYQTFIDLLTNHSKSTSSAFLRLYSPLSEAPDPYPLLEASVESLVISEDTLPRITRDNEHLQRTVKRLTTQLDDTEKRLEDERAARKAVSDAQEARVKDVEASWTAVLEEKKDNWEAKERSLEDKVENQERLLKEIKASYEVSQRLGSAEEEGNDHGPTSAIAAELEIVSLDLERTNLRLAEVESRNEQLRLELAQSTSSSTVQQNARAEDDPRFLRLQSENSSLLRKIDAARFEKDSEKRNWESKIRALERETVQLKADRNSLNEKISKWSDYEDVKRELEMLKSIEFATGDDDDFDGDAELDGIESASRGVGGPENGNAVGTRADSLEQLLIARNKKLGNELTVLRVSHQDLQGRLEALQEGLSRTNAELERSRNLNATLENDLLKVQQETSNSFPAPAMSVAGTHTSRYPHSSANYTASSFAGRRGRISPTSSIISGREGVGNAQLSMDALRAGEPVGGGSGILPMVTAQRDRFKQRNSQLEDELSKSLGTVSSLRQEIASLQKDNLNLYEKTRYVSSYNRSTPAASSSSSAYPSDPNPATIQVSSSTPSGLSLDRYRSAYEANISPFAAFRGRESARALKRMSLPERIVFTITRMVLANKTSRNLFAAYCLALHLLVFAMLYWMGTADIEKHASNLGDAASAVVENTQGALGSEGDAQSGDWQQEGFSGGA
ncbi:MAG: hypothetical protein M1825_004593 [Sarcosagium campestre]|nr:MAG: hypothetical protein M1825_004593 [Sarcosagium campestre]